ncbi:WcbI family polysaccharide biosynthesis putative acetyltransferase [Paenibacillus tarimensis]
MFRKKNCIVYGTCQVTPIRNHLMSSPTFRSQYNILDIPFVHHIGKNTGLNESLLANCDLFIYQRVSETYSLILSTDYLIRKLPKHCIKISFSFCYFTGYFPQYVNDPNGFVYGDINVARFLSEGRSNQEIISIISDENFYSYHQLTSILENTLYQLRIREVGLDIVVADYIESLFRENRLFYTYNHPTYHLTCYMAKRMLLRLGISPNEISEIRHETYASDHTHPIYPSVIRHLNLKFVRPGERSFIMNGYPVTFGEYIRYYLEYVRTKL